MESNETLLISANTQDLKSKKNVEENCEEGIITNEPPGNEYPKIDPNLLDRFPYFLIGQIRSSFNIPLTPKTQKQGVGILIGPNVVLTAAHVLCQKLLNEKKEKTIFNAIEVFFGPSCTENFSPLNNFVCSENYYINEKYIDLLQEKEQVEFDKVDEKYKNDWALIFLPYNVGDHIQKLFDVDTESQEKLKVKNGIYQFFQNSISDFESLKVDLQEGGSKEISLIAYTEKNIDFNQIFPREENVENFNQNEADLNLNVNEKPKQHNKNVIDSTINLINGDNYNNNHYSESINIKLQTEHRKNLVETPKTKTSNQAITKKGLKKNDFVLFNSALENLKEKLKNNNMVSYKEKQENNVLSMCESKGFLYYPKGENNENFLYYQFNTLKGQSGAPVFLRVKNKHLNDNKNFDPTAHIYSYYFIGLHIRRGPNMLTPFTVLTDFQFDVESKVLGNNRQHQNSLYQTPRNNENSYINSKLLDIDTDPKSKVHESVINNNSTCVVSKKQQENYDILRNIKKEHGVCEYNISLKLTKNVISQIFVVLKSNTNAISNNFSNLLVDNSVKSNYIMINLFYNNQNKIKGLFTRGTELLAIFRLAGKILNVKKRYTCLELKSSDDIKYRTYHKQIYEYDKNKKLNDLVLDNFNSVGSFSFNNSEYCINFDIGLNISLYSDFLSERILNKVSQNQNIDLAALKQNPAKFAKFLMVAIYVEIKDFNNVYPTYGDMFNTLKSKLGLNNKQLSI